MPWCPRCGSEYGDDLVSCPNCTVELTHDDTAPELKKPGRLILELVAAGVLAPWLMVPIIAVMSIVTYALVPQLGFFVTIAIAAALVIAAGVIYGSLRHPDISPNVLFVSWVLGGIIQSIIMYVHMQLSAFSEMWHLIFMIPLALGFSLAFLLAVRHGANRWLSR